MHVGESVFLQFNLPNAATWFYFSLLLAVGLFFKFSRLLSIRNWDVLTLFLLVPGLLLLLQADTAANHSEQTQLTRWAYIWLLCGSGYFGVRCLADLALVRRPALSPNLSLGGLAWLGVALFISLVAVAVRTPSRADPADVRGGNGAEAPPDAKQPPMPRVAKDLAVDVVGRQTAARNLEPGADVRVWVERALTILCHLAIVLGLVCIGWRHFQDVHGGVAAGTFYLLLPYGFLLLPYTGLQIGQWSDVWPVALIVWAVAVYRKPTLAGLLIGTAAGSVYFPVFLVPLWCSFYWGRGAGRFLGAVVLAGLLCLAVMGVMFWVQGELPPSLQTTLTVSDWQPWKQPAADTQGFWHGIHWAYRMPIFIAYLALVLTTALWPSPKNLAHVIALSAAVLVGIQFWYADRGGVYVLWYLPLLLLLAFRPNLTGCQPPPINPDTDWLTRARRRLGRLALRLLGVPPATARC
jgi:hypothetical protein